jgi:hypothetical protein
MLMHINILFTLLIIMISSIVVFVLIRLTFSLTGSQLLYQLSPSIPPTAFLSQYYTCQFRVIGLDFPAFKFDGLPKELTGEPSGIIKGTPLSMGSYIVNVSYSTNLISQSKQTILRVALSADSPKNSQVQSTLSPRFSITANTNSYVFLKGTQVRLNFTANMGSPPYSWTYQQLPKDLAGSQNASIIGFF